MNPKSSILTTPRTKFRQALEVMRNDSNLQDKANVYSWSMRHLAYKILNTQGYYYFKCIACWYKSDIPF